MSFDSDDSDINFIPAVESSVLGSALQFEKSVILQATKTTYSLTSRLQMNLGRPGTSRN